MPVKSDRWSIEMARERGMIEPFSDAQVRKGISYGVSSYGYDFRLSRHFRTVRPTVAELDPKSLSDNTYEEIDGDSLLIPANSYVLARSFEYFRIPRDVLTICSGKSTYARCGLVVNVTPFEPEWEGFATLSLANTAPVPVRVYAEEGIAQLVFLEAAELCQVSYNDKKGKYQGQRKITLAKSDTDSGDNQ